MSKKHEDLQRELEAALAKATALFEKKPNDKQYEALVNGIWNALVALRAISTKG